MWGDSLAIWLPIAISKTVFASETNFSSSQLVDGREFPILFPIINFIDTFIFETPQKLINYCHQLTDRFSKSGNWRPTPSFSLARSWFESLGWVTTQAMASKTGKLAKILFDIFLFTIRAGRHQGATILGDREQGLVAWLGQWRAFSGWREEFWRDFDS